jgi:hypothetical protein
MECLSKSIFFTAVNFCVIFPCLFVDGFFRAVLRLSGISLVSPENALNIKLRKERRQEREDRNNKKTKEREREREISSYNSPNVKS